MGITYTATDWDFKNEDTKTYTHCFHNYPAMMIPQVAGGLLEKYGKKSKLLFDPYCGTGTSLVEAILRNINAIGTDLNPLAKLIAKAKTTPINIKTLDLYLKNFNDVIFGYRFGINLNASIGIPQFPNINYWFSKDTQFKLALIKNYIDNIGEPAIQDFFKVAFSETVRESSWTTNSEFKLLRMPPPKIEKFDPDVFGIMEFKLARNRNGIISFQKAFKHISATARVYSFNSVDAIPPNILPENSVDIVLTSPPYGDSRTTVAYGQFSRLANQWLNFENASNVDKELMGGKRIKQKHHFGIDILDETVNEISRQDPNRGEDVISFFLDYEHSIKNISRVVKNSGYVCYVVGNRSVKGRTVPTSGITIKFFEKYDFNHIETIERNIPNKRMPLENSPSNISGVKSPTIKKEYIVICQKS